MKVGIRNVWTVWSRMASEEKQEGLREDNKRKCPKLSIKMFEIVKQ